MASSTTESGLRSATGHTPTGQNDTYIEQRINKTRLQVKLVELFGSLMVLASGVLGFMLLLAVVDAWLFDLGLWGRLIALLVMLGGAGVYFFVVVLPLMIRRINPVFAARSIEEAEPSLKNSLINFLLFRSNRVGVHEKVYQGLENQAAAGLSQVALESAVDRSRLIKIGYVLAAIMVVCGVYKVASPKDPFQTVSRVAAPFADLPRPSRVQIGQRAWLAEVRPGDIRVVHGKDPRENSATQWTEITSGEVQIFHGQTLKVFARVEGAKSGDGVTLFYTTADGQAVDAPIIMRPNDSGLYHQCTLSSGDGGIQQDLSYYIAAGDARTKRLNVKVRTAPSIIVRQVKYNYPDYTDREERTVEGQGDIEAIEGTQVTLFAEANLPIDKAYLELNPRIDDASADQSSATKIIPMNWDGRRAEGEFYLELQADRTTPVYDRYCIRFETESGDRNENPLVHRIDVTPDLAPEVQILSPDRDRIELPANRTAKIEIRALDPDFALSKIKLRAISGGVELLDLPLLEQTEIGDIRPLWSQFWSSLPVLPRLSTVGVEVPLGETIHWMHQRRNRANRTGQATVNFQFTPSEYKLRANDEVVYWAVAEDNRTSVRHQLPEPNVTRTRNFYIKVLPPEGDDGVGVPNSRPDPPEQQDDTGGTSEDNQAASGGQSGGSTSAESTSESSDSGMSGGTAGGTSAEGTSGEAPPEAGSSETQDSGSGDKSPTDGGPSGDAKLPSDRTDGAAGENAKPKPLDPSETTTGSDNRHSTHDTRHAPGAGGQPQPGVQPDSAGDQNREEPLHDGQAFERLKDYLAKKQEEKASNNTGENTGQDSTTEAPDNQHPTEDGESKTEGDHQTSQKPAAQDSNDAANGDRTQQSDSIESGEDLGDSEPAGAHDPSTKPAGVPQGSEETRQEQADAQQTSTQEKDAGEGDGGQSGAGHDDQSTDGSPPGTGQNLDREKKQEPDASDAATEHPKSPNQSQRQSDSKDGLQGDRSGGGGPGGGQGSKQEGNDSAGSSSPSDFGAGASSESGNSETSDRAGDDVLSESGKQGTESGAGSETRRNPEGDHPAPKPGQESGNKGSTPFGGSGGTAETDPADQPYRSREIPEAEKANLEYARKATDLVLDDLEHQRDNPDGELLDELGWTEEDLRNFIDRWETLKRNAEEGGAADRRELDDALRSLGLRPADGRVQRVGTEDDTLRGLRDEAGLGDPPAEYIDQFNAFIKGTARAGKAE